MQKNNGILSKLRRRFLKLRLQPIRVLCFHQVSESFDPLIYCKPDWISLADFKGKINSFLQQGYKFISLEEAYHHIRRDFIRTRKYVVLTADDGLKCQLELIPWLEENNIPLTMFLNVETLTGDKCGEPMMQYFNIVSKEQERAHSILYATANNIAAVQSSILSFGLHGIDHRGATSMTYEEYRSNIIECKTYLNKIVSTVPFYAYTYGIRTKEYDDILHENNFIPVYMDGRVNYNNSYCVHREIM
jgi:peptidoglycan/xylan/chitin deacetylase (PgdA/CDA1 family)